MWLLNKKCTAVLLACSRGGDLVCGSCLWLCCGGGIAVPASFWPLKTSTSYAGLPLKHGLTRGFPGVYFVPLSTNGALLTMEGHQTFPFLPSWSSDLPLCDECSWLSLCYGPFSFHRKCSLKLKWGKAVEQHFPFLLAYSLELCLLIMLQLCVFFYLKNHARG